MASWVNGESGPTCKCGSFTNVVMPQDGLPILMCFCHTRAEGACWCLPTEKPDNWLNLSDEEMQALIVKGEQEHEQHDKENV